MTRANLPGGPITHVGYAVADISAAAGRWASTVGAGPFFLLPEGELGELSHRGEPAVFDHRIAFGQWGPLVVELQRLDDVRPAGFADVLARPHGGLNHVSYLTDEIDAESERLEALGMPCVLSARGAAVELSYHDAPQLGHAVELVRRVDFLEDFYAMLAREHRGWDGREPLRDA